MKETSNFRLNQWEKTDRIQMEDFNADNLKTDQALAAEQAARQAADQTEARDRQNADRAEQTAREAADAALKTRVDALTPKAGLQFLRTVTLQTSGSSVYLDLGEIDWNQWKAVHLSLDVYLAEDYNVGVDVEGANCGYLYANTTPPDKGDPNRNLIHIILYPLYDSRHAVCLIYMSPSNSGISDSTSRFQDLRSVHLHNSNTTVLAGTTCDIWGEK